MSDDLVNLKTISRIFHELAFKNKETRISAKTLQLSAQYIRLFINEAIERSNEERIHEGSLEVDGIDNIEAEDNDISVEEEVPDITLIEDAPTQYNRAPEPDDNALDARHLSKITGTLVLDF